MNWSLSPDCVDVLMWYVPSYVVEDLKSLILLHLASRSLSRAARDVECWPGLEDRESPEAFMRVKSISISPVEF